jgi:hypothetical protein
VEAVICGQADLASADEYQVERIRSAHSVADVMLD